MRQRGSPQAEKESDDAWRQKLIETLTITATGTSKAAAGLKAFKSIESIAIASAGDATTNTLNLGWGDVLGLPYRLVQKADILRVYFNGTVDNSATVVAADATDPATATTGDVRGTVDTASASDGSEVVVWMHVESPNTANGLKGLDQYAG